MDPADRELTISCGAALGNLRVALRHLGHAGDVRTLPDPLQPRLLTTVALGPVVVPTTTDHELFAAITRRRTDRSPFEDRPVPDAVLHELRRAATQEGSVLHAVCGDTARRALTELIAEGDRRQFADPRFRRELASWMRSNRGGSKDGMPGYTQGLGAMASLVAPLVVRASDVGKGQAAKDSVLAADHSPVLAVLSTVGDAPADWLAAGQALARVLLSATAAGLSASFLNQPAEVPELRGRLRALLDLGGEPQLVLRVGYGTGTQPTPPPRCGCRATPCVSRT